MNGPEMCITAETAQYSSSSLQTTKIADKMQLMYNPLKRGRSGKILAPHRGAILG